MISPILKPKDKPRRREPNPRVLPDGRVIFRKPSKAWDEQRLRVYTRDRGRCLDCGPDSKVLYFNGGEWYNRAEIDHIKAKRMGRDAFTDDREENLATRCSVHHTEKHDKGN
jgi:5-methylcytosine-specific restriction endonuclease McrA